jgi:hypothetical protein
VNWSAPTITTITSTAVGMARASAGCCISIAAAVMSTTLQRLSLPRAPESPFVSSSAVGEY